MEKKINEFWGNAVFSLYLKNDATEMNHENVGKGFVT